MINKSDYEYCIEVENGKYHVVMTKDYRVKFLRGGEDWVDSPQGSKMLIALMAETERKEEEIERLRKALEFYANEQNHESPIWDEHGQFLGSIVDKDNGKIAREALNNGEALHGNPSR